MKRKGIFNQTGVIFATCLLVLIFSHTANAANQYILGGASGTYATTKCDSWEINRACDDLPTSLVRGDTYYIADGTYGAHIFNDAESGSTYITIKKATESAHGTDIGWDKSYGDGQAIFTSSKPVNGYITVINFAKGYYVWDGMVGAGSDPRTYGFKVVAGVCGYQERLMGLPNIGYAKYQIDHIKVSHTAMPTCGASYSTTQQVGIYGSALSGYDATDLEISHNYFAYSTASILLRGWKNSSIHDNYFYQNWGSATAHSQQISAATSTNIFVYNNIFKDTLDFLLSAHNESGGNSYWNIYNNIVIGGTGGFAMGESGELDGLVSSQFHNNTFVNVAFQPKGAIFVGNLTNVATQKSYAYNNLFYNCSNPRMDNVDKTAGAIIHDNNAYLSCTGIYSSAAESTPLIDNVDPFVDLESGNLRLAVGAKPNSRGKNLSIYFTTDKDGRPRGSSLWSIGAYRAAGPAPPENITITIKQ